MVKRNPKVALRQISRTWHYLALFAKPVLFLIFLISLGTVGYIILEEYNVIEGVYMTVITITTVGFSEVRPLSTNGRLFTTVLILGGVFFYGLAINSFLRTFLERSFRGFMEQQRALESIKQLNNHYIVCGGGRMALAIVHELDRSNQKFVVLEKDEESPIFTFARRERLDWLILKRDALVDETLLEAHIDTAKGLFAVLPTDADNLFVVLSARALNADILIETRISHETSRKKMLQAGADKVLSPYLVGGMQMARSMLRPEVDEFLEVFLTDSSYEFQMKVFKVQPNDQRIDKPLRDWGFANEGLMAVGVRHKNGSINFAPNADTVIAADSEVFLVGKGRLTSEE